MRVVVTLQAEDVLRFRAALARAAQRVACADALDIVAGAKHALDTLPIASAPGYVRERIGAVQRLIVMLEDEAWGLPAPERDQVLQVLAYFSDPDDLIPDDVEGIGLLDDAIMLELLLRDIRHVMNAHERFCRWRRALPATSDPGARARQAIRIAEQRQTLVSRMRAATQRGSGRRASASRPASLAP